MENTIERGEVVVSRSAAPAGVRGVHRLARVCADDRRQAVPKGPDRLIVEDAAAMIQPRSREWGVAIVESVACAGFVGMYGTAGSGPRSPGKWRDKLIERAH